MVRAVAVPRMGEANALRFRKVSRVKPKGVAVMSLAAVPAAIGRAHRGARVAYGDMGPMPVRARASSGSWKAHVSTSKASRAPLSVATEGLDRRRPTHSPATWYRRETVAGVHLKRLLLGWRDGRGWPGNRFSSTLNGTDKATFVEDGQNLLECCAAASAI